MPARASLITGRYSRQIGALTMSGDLFPQIPTMMQALQRHGYQTFGIGKFHYLQTAPWDIGENEGPDALADAEDGVDTRLFGYDYVWEAAGKQLMTVNYCHYSRYLQDHGLLQQAAHFWKTSGGANGDTPNHNYDKTQPWPFPLEHYPDVVIAREAIRQLEALDGSRPFFMKVSFLGPHKPYDAPQAYLDRVPDGETDEFIPGDGGVLSAEEAQLLHRQRRSSMAMMTLIDDQIGAILEVLRRRGLYEDTLIVFTSDHGDMLGDHYYLQKGCPWRQALNVPLAIRLPGGQPLGPVDAPVEYPDITATILDYAGLDPKQALSRPWPAYNDRIPGRSLLPILRGDCGRVREFAYSESDFTEERAPGTRYEDIVRGRGFRRTNAWRAVTTETAKYIRYLDYDAPGGAYEEFYDLSVDPDERVNRIDDPEYAGQIQLAWERMLYVVDQYPPCQLTWGRLRRDLKRKYHL